MLLSVDIFGLTDEEAKRKRWLMVRMAIGAGIAVMLVLALMPDSARTPWGDFLIAAGAFLLTQFATEMRISLRQNRIRRAAARGLLAAAIVGGLIAAVAVPSGKQEIAEAEPSADEIVEFIEENVMKTLAIAGPM